MHIQSQTTATDRSDTDSIIYKNLLALSWGIYGGIIGAFLFFPLEKEGKSHLNRPTKKAKSGMLLSEKRYVTVGKAVCYCREKNFFWLKYVV